LVLNQQKITKWIRKIYDDLLELNHTNPEYFTRTGTRYELYLRHWDMSMHFTTSLIAPPNLHDTFIFPFIRPCLGTEYFFVKQIQHELINGSHTITLWLSGGFVNTYRELLYDKARFYRLLSMQEEFSLTDAELDEILRKHYRG